MRPLFHPLPQAVVDHYRAGGADAYGRVPEQAVSDGDGVPCRASLRMVPAGAPYLILAHRPFAALNPYAETGPIFVGAEAAPVAAPGYELPEVLRAPTYILRGYSADERIVYGTGGVIATERIPERCSELLSRDDVAFVHIRSATNNCFFCRVDRG